MAETTKPSTKVTLPGKADLIVRCLKCGDKHDVEDVTVTFDAVIDEDTGEFVQFDVEFSEDGVTVYIADLLCVPKHCSVFGRLPSGAMFAFPWLTPGKHDNWHSKPDKRGDHYAMRGSR